MALGCFAAFAIVPAEAQAPDSPLLEGLKKGAWEIRFRGGMPDRRICIRTGRELIQLQHNGQTCGKYSIESAESEVTVQYSCRGSGYGRTNLRMETPRLVQIESHGIKDDLPFQFSAEARFVGACD